MSGTRDEKIDALKCVAIVFVIIGHAIVFTSLFPVAGPGRVLVGTVWVQTSSLNSLLLNVAYSFHMPLFAFLSAYVLFGREGSPGSLVRKRALGLLLPYAVWVGISWVLYGPRTLAGTIDYFKVRALYPQSPNAAWFLYALFGCFLLFAIVRALKGRDRMLIASAVLMMGVLVLPWVSSNPLGITDIAWLYPFFVMGYLSSEHAEELRAHRMVLMVSGVVVWAALLPFIWPVLVPELNWWYPELREFLHSMHLPGAVVVLYAVRYTCAAAAITALYSLYDYVRGRALTWQAWVGRRTLGMYVIQPYILMLVSRTISQNWVVLAVAAFGGSLALTWLLEQNRYTRLVLLGQRRSRPATTS